MNPADEIAELKHQVERLSLFHEVAKSLASTLDLQKILQAIMEKISDFFHPDTWSLQMVDEKARDLYFEFAIGSGAEKLKDVRIKFGEGIAGWGNGWLISTRTPFPFGQVTFTEAGASAKFTTTTPLRRSVCDSNTE